jgi:hypothetical protein
LAALFSSQPLASYEFPFGLGFGFSEFSGCACGAGRFGAGLLACGLLTGARFDCGRFAFWLGRGAGAGFALLAGGRFVSGLTVLFGRASGLGCGVVLGRAVVFGREEALGVFVLGSGRAVGRSVRGAALVFGLLLPGATVAGGRLFGCGRFASGLFAFGLFTFELFG